MAITSAPAAFAVSAAASVNGVVPLAATAMTQSRSAELQIARSRALACRGVVLVRALDAGIEREALGEHEGEPLHRPAERRAELHAVERRLAPGGAGAGIDQAPVGLDPSAIAAGRGGDRRERRAHRGDRPRLPVEEGVENFRVVPGVEPAIALDRIVSVSVIGDSPSQLI